MSQPMLNTRCFVNVVKIKESLITNVEAKILSFMLVKNKQISTLDFSGSIDEDMKFNKIYYDIKLCELEDF